MGSKYFRDNVNAMTGYTPGEQPKVNARIIKLNTNENPYPPSPKAIDAAREAAGDNLRLYPDPLATELRIAAGEALGFAPDNIIAGNGSDELLMMLLRGFVTDGGRVAYPVPTYSLYDTLVEAHGAVAITPNWTKGWELPDELAKQNAELVILCRPNAPSGTTISVETVAELAEKLDCVLCVDEAYVDFADDNCLSLVNRFDNVIILRTLSKSYSLAGSRIGIAISNTEIISGLNKIRDSYNMDRVAIATGVAAIKDQAWMRANTQKILDTRARLTAELTDMGFDVLPSETNFVFAKIGERAKEIYEKLKERGIFVRYFNKEDLKDGLRITVGTEVEIDALIGAIKEILG